MPRTTRSRLTATCCCDPVSDSPSRSSAAFAPAVSPWARLWAASWSAVAAAPLGAAGGGLLLGELPGEVRLLLAGHLVELVAQVAQVLLRLLRVAVRVGALLPGRRARERAAQRGQRRGALLRRRVDLGADVALDRAELGEVHVEVARTIPELAGEVAELLRQPRPRVFGVGALVLELLAPGRRAARPAPARPRVPGVLRDDRVLRVRDEQDRGEEQHGEHRRDRRPPREPRA